MITEQDLQEAIAECEGYKNPNANTCIKLAAFYTIREHMFPNTEKTGNIGYSFKPPNNIIEYSSGTEFSDLVNGRGIEDVLPIIDDLMDTLSVINPKLYASVIRRFDS